MATASDQQCPNCGKTIPSEAGQHAGSLVSGTVTCPHCGESVDLAGTASEQPTGDVERAAAAPPGHHEPDESFSGQETPEAVADDLKHKPT